MFKLKKLHDYIKVNYENNKYSKIYYTSTSEKTSDFILGTQQAFYDYNHKKLKYYPLFIVKIINKLINDKLIEIVDFISGYNYEKTN